MRKKNIAIIGSGPAALMAAIILSDFHNVTIYEKNAGIGKKFLVAGKGGFNLTNSLSGIELANKYSPKDFMEDAILAFDSIALRKWYSNLGIETFIGTSGRVFPEKGIKPAEVLNKIKDKLSFKNVKIKYNHEFIGFDNEYKPKFNFKSDSVTISSDFYIFALGGASWSVTGSDGKWAKYFEKIGVNIIPFEASNCGVNIKWDKQIIKNHAGKPIKNISVSINGNTLKGEAVITEYGLEGNVIYPLIPQIRELLKTNSKTEITIDFKPNNSADELIQKLKNLKSDSKNYAAQLNLNREQLAVIKSFSSKEEYLSQELFVQKVKNLSVKVESLRDIEESISTVGGIDLKELDHDFSLKKHSNIYTIGEMVNWDAPTGGFLLQGSFSMGYFAANSILKLG